jgi:hypothetical protein
MSYAKFESWLEGAGLLFIEGISKLKQDDELRGRPICMKASIQIGLRQPQCLSSRWKGCKRP